MVTPALACVWVTVSAKPPPHAAILAFSFVWVHPWFLGGWGDLFRVHHVYLMEHVRG